jgi:PKD repeat protein
MRDESHQKRGRDDMMYRLWKLAGMMVIVLLLGGIASGAGEATPGEAGALLEPSGLVITNGELPRFPAGYETIVDGEVRLTAGTFTLTPVNDAAPVEVDNLTILGALNAAAEQSGLTYAAALAEFTDGSRELVVDSIDGIEVDFGAEPAPLVWGGTPGDGNYYVKLANVAVADGDEVLIFYTPQNDQVTPEDWRYLLVLDVVVGNATSPEAAGFTADVTNGDTPLTVRFTDTSTVTGITAWEWDFGNGFLSVNQNPVYTYHRNGTYTVTLTVTDATNTRYTEVQEGFITVGAAAPPEPALSIYETAAAEGNFTTLVAALDLTDLNTTFNETGPYTVFAPTDDAFDALPEGVLAGLMNDTAALADVLSYHAADGEYMAADLANLTELETLLGENVTITSDAANGTLMVDNATVIIADIECSNGIIHAIDAVLVPAGGDADGGGGEGGVADFEANITKGPAPLSVAFTDLSTVQGIEAWSWEFGDGGTSEEQHPIHTYGEPGVYDVRLTVSLAIDNSTRISVSRLEPGYITVTT